MNRPSQRYTPEPDRAADWVLLFVWLGLLLGLLATPFVIWFRLLP